MEKYKYFIEEMASLSSLFFMPNPSLLGDGNHRRTCEMLLQCFMEIKRNSSQEITEGVINDEKNRNTEYPQTDGYRKTRRMRRMPDILPVRL